MNGTIRTGAEIGKAGIALLVALSCANISIAQTPLPIPNIASGSVINLTVQEGQHRIPPRRGGDHLGC